MRIAIIRRNGLGDLLSVMPLIAFCKEKFTGCHITLFVDERAAELIPYLNVEEAVIFSGNKYFSLLKAAWVKRKERFDLAISTRPTPMKMLNIFLSLLRAQETRAYVDDKWHSKLVSHPTPFEKEKPRHQMVKGLRLLDSNIEEVEQKWWPKLRVKKTWQFKKKSLLVSVSNNRIGSLLDTDKVADVLNQLSKQKEFEVVINCLTKDKERAKELSLLLKMETHMIPTESLDDLLGLMASVDGLFIGDGGNMHLAAALDKPQVVLFGGTEVWEWAPLSTKAICLRDPHNVNFIPQEEMLAALKKIL
jgi:ADP-heptose:LPS heptosyltransferase